MGEPWREASPMEGPSWGCWPLAGGSPAASHFLLLRQKESNPRKGDPAHPRIPENRTCRVGGKELAPLFLYFEGERGSDTFAADPPGRPDFRRD